MMPALYEHCVAAYNAMEEQASTEEVEEGVSALVYEGFLTKLITEDLNLSLPYYTKILQELRRMQCATQIRRGGSTTPSKWILVQPPTPELWEKMVAPLSRKATQQQQTDQALRSLNERISRIEESLGI